MTVFFNVVSSPVTDVPAFDGPPWAGRQLRAATETKNNKGRRLLQ